MIGLVIYLTGAIAAYWRMRKTWINIGNEEGWDRVFCCFICALISWVGVLVASALDHTAKPPKWL
jgi:hypothetical protein